MLAVALHMGQEAETAAGTALELAAAAGTVAATTAAAVVFFVAAASELAAVSEVTVALLWQFVGQVTGCGTDPGNMAEAVI